MPFPSHHHLDSTRCFSHLAKSFFLTLLGLFNCVKFIYACLHISVASMVLVGSLPTEKIYNTHNFS